MDTREANEDLDVDYCGEHGEVVVTLELLLGLVMEPAIRSGLLGVLATVAGPAYAGYVDECTGSRAGAESVDA